MLKGLFLIIGTTLLFASSYAMEGVPPGYDAASFARMGVGARAQAMGGAFVAIAQGPTAGYWNPAGLGYVEDFQIEGMYTDWLGAGIDFQYVSIAGYPPIGEERPRLALGDHLVTFGLTWVSTHVGDIPWWEEDGGYGTFDAWSHLVIFSVGWQLKQTPSLSIGFNIKTYHDRILEGSSFGIGFDLGLLVQGTIGAMPVSLGVVSTDFGNTKIQWYGTTGEPVNYVPWLMKAGMAARPWQRVLTSVSYEWGVNRPRFERLRVGIEVSLEWLALRAGYEWDLSTDTGRWTAGGGITYEGSIMLDYAYVLTPLGNSHLITIRLTW